MIKGGYFRNLTSCGLSLALALGLMAVGLTGCAPAFPVANSMQEQGMVRLTLPETIRLPSDVTLNPVEPKVAFVGIVSETDSNLCILDIASGTITTTLPPHTYYPISTPKWSPDGTRISFSGGSYPQGEAGIFMVQADSEPVYVTSGNGAVWSPDGSKLAVVDLVKGNSQIKIVDLSDGTARPIFATHTGSKQFISDLDWSSNAQALAFTMTDEQNRYQVRHLYRIDQDGSNFKILVPDPGGQSVTGPKWILDGKWIAFLQGLGLDQTLNFVRSDGQCIVSPLKNLNTIVSLDISRDGTKAIIQLGNSLYVLDIPTTLSPQSLNAVLVCN
jgi:dipeptidyl aminopeptidase/acylaminoacyl peptidase